jgi:hypothetical protein
VIASGKGRDEEEGIGSRDWELLLESKASYQNACIANNDPIPNSPIPIPYKAKNQRRKTWR